MNRLCFLTAVGLGLVTFLFPKSVASAAEAAAIRTKPNIILILADDVGIGDVGCSGGHFKTPNIDALAKEGTRFESCYATPLCGPSRCQLLTGRYPFRTGLINNYCSDAIQPNREIMIPTVLKQAGYVTASVGKWGQMSHGPGEWGFDKYLMFPGNGCYWRYQTPYYEVNGKRKQLGEGEYLPDVMHGYLVNFVRNHQEQPFFVYYPMSHIHEPILPTPDSQVGERFEFRYADNIAYMDKLVGELVNELDRLHLREKTLVLFTGDNGTARFAQNIATVDGQLISGTKGLLSEGGSRVPLIANWPGTTPAGVVNRDLTDFSDFFATLVELGGATLPADVTLDSHSLAPQIQGGKGSPRDWIYVELNGHSYVRDARYKLTDTGELFDMKSAPFTETLVSADTNDTDVIAAQSRLQAILDTHPAAVPLKETPAKRPPRPP